jgi:hypothetical protein
MKAIGFWLDSLRDTTRVPPQELVRPLPDDVRTAVSDYLDQGDVFRTYRGKSWCRFGCVGPRGHRELSDGRWFWPEDLGHYVRDHGVTLPPAFIGHVLSGTPPIPQSEWETSADDPTEWDRWCRENASEAYRQRLDQARNAAEAQLQRDLASAITQRERGHELSEQPCMHAGCANRAIRGMVICPSCWFRREHEEMMSVQAYGNLGWLMEMYPGAPTAEDESRSG